MSLFSLGDRAQRDPLEDEVAYLEILLSDLDDILVEHRQRAEAIRSVRTRVNVLINRLLVDKKEASG